MGRNFTQETPRLMRALLLGGPEHGRIEDVTRWPVRVLEKTSIDIENIYSYRDEMKAEMYHERKLQVFDRGTTVGVHSNLTNPQEYSALIFTTLIKEFYQELFWRR